MRNLDTLAAQTAQHIVEKAVPEGTSEVKKRAAAVENMATKALGVLQENGVYAGMLFLYSKGADDYAKGIREMLLRALDGIEISGVSLGLPKDKPSDKWQDVSSHLTKSICGDLDTLLLVKQLWEQTLIYVRYGAKARGCEP